MGIPHVPSSPRRKSPLRLATAVLATCLLSASVASPVAAQVRGGGQAVYQSEFQDGTFGLGGRAEVDLGFIFDGLAIAGTYDRFLPDCDECSFWEAGGQVIIGNGTFHFGVGSSFQRFERGGDLAELGTTEDWAFNLMTGLRFVNVPVVTPFVEFRQEVLGEPVNEQTFSVGVLFGPPSGRRPPGRPGPR